MTDLEPLLRQHFSAEADEVPTTADLLDGVDLLCRRRRRRRFVSAGSALAVAVVAAAVALPLAVVGGHGESTRVTVSPNQPGVPATPPPGERAVTWAGIQFYVPATWTSVGGDASADSCARAHYRGGVVGYESTVPIAAVGCMPLAHSTLERLQLARFHPCTGACKESPFPTEGQLAGLPALYSTVTSLGQLTTFVQVPSRGVLFTLTTNTQSRANAILASGHPVSVDENGCAVDQPGYLAKVAGGGAGGPQVLGTPVSGVVCSYIGARLVMGVTIGAKDLGLITTDLNRLPARYTAAQLAAQRSPKAFSSGGFASIRLTDAGGHTQQITVQGPLSGIRPGVAGTTQSTLTQALSADLSDALPSGFGANAFPTGPAAELPAG